jgi:hypothetical protein
MAPRAEPRVASGMAVIGTTANRKAAIGAARHVAPDGRPGFGTRPHVEVLKLVRQPERADEAWIAALDALHVELAQRQSVSESLYRSRGWFAISGDEPGQGLPEFFASYRHLELDPGNTLLALDARAQAFASAWTDLRFRARARLLEHAEVEARELRLSLALLRGDARSWGALSAAEAENLARRADLAAALSRALRLDLDALREAPGKYVAAPEADACIALVRDSDAQRRRERLTDLEGWLAEREAAFLRPLFHARLSEHAVATLAWRKSSTDLAQRARVAAEDFSPDIEHVRAVEPKISAMRTLDRRRSGLVRALEGLAQDPLDVRLTWLAFVNCRNAGSVPQTLAFAYRYLLLRGIVYEDGAQQGRKVLSSEEETAQTYVRDALSGAYGCFPGIPAVTVR